MTRRDCAVLCCWALFFAAGPAFAFSVEPDDLLASLPISPSGLTACEVQLGPGMGAGAPGTAGHPVALLLANTSLVASLALDVTDTPDLVVATGCTSLVPDFDCAFIESAGSAAVLMTSPSSASIPVGFVPRPVAELLYAVVAGAPLGTIALDGLNGVVVDAFGQGCTASVLPGNFLVNRCGDGTLDPGEDCDDGNASDGDCCSSSCQLETCEDDNACTADTCVAGTGCVFDPTPLDGTPCGSPASWPCNDPDTCLSGSCDPGLAPVGTPCGDSMSAECNAPDSCNVFGACSPNLAPAGAACGNPDATTCDAPDACNGSGQCTPQYSPAGIPCNLGLYCFTPGACNSTGGCQDSTPTDCTDGVACTIDGCDEAEDQCTHDPDDALCATGGLCNGAEICNPVLGCQPGTPVNCPSDGIACTQDFCSNPTGTCVHLPQNNACSDGQFCNGSEICDTTDGCVKGRPPCPPEICDESTNSCANIANDDCESATPVAVPSVTAGTTIGATLDAPPFCGTTNTAPGVWYTFVGDGTTLTVSTCETVGSPPGSATYDTKISVYCMDCATPVCIGGNDDVAGCSFHSAVSWCSSAGATYRVLVHGDYPATGSFTLGVSSNGVACDHDVSCQPPLPGGACCFTTECPYSQGEVPVSCHDGLQADDCEAVGGAYQGDDSTCTVPVNQIDVEVYPALYILQNYPPGVNSTLQVTRPATIADLDVDIGITHTWNSDLIITVIGPTGVSQVIWDEACGSFDNINATADDSGMETVCPVIGAGPIDGVFFPPNLIGKGPLSVFDGTEAQGTWTLNVADNFGADLGWLNQWSVHIIEGVPQCLDMPCSTTAFDIDCDGDEDSDSRSHLEDPSTPEPPPLRNLER